ncbi:hypothetical protein C1645_727838 [Glomus cerebriforme]|uniref:Carbohydrate-binding module family 19 domain-containing protein n=1 Tax=Glomus cerebriforme TaxID=658196 RepID=A0A397SKK1_9GLOM|nr:hypothetical protein C1645_727838 [Glomus cerebriforme]
MKFSTLFAFAITYTTLVSAQGNFRSANADQAEKLTNDFAKLTPNSPCTDGQQACVNDQFAQCVGGKFQLNSCGGGDLKCVVLPLVNKPGTSITCDTEADRLARLADARGNQSPVQSKVAAPSGGNIADIRKKNADAAEALQNQFKTLTPDSKCTNNEVACVNSQVAQCANGKFALSPCAPGTECAALPLVLKEGTSVACTTEADRVARIDQARKNLK